MICMYVIKYYLLQGCLGEKVVIYCPNVAENIKASYSDFDGTYHNKVRGYRL